MKKIKVLSASAISGFMLCALASCGSSPATVVNTLSDSTCGALSDYALNGTAIQNPETTSQTFKAGDTLTFAATAAEDYNVGMIKYSNADGTKMAKLVSEGGKIRYSITLAAGVNKITPSYDIDAEKDFVEAFKLPISDAVYEEIMKTPDQKTTYDLRKNGIEQMQTTYTDGSDAFINYVDGDTTHFTTRNYGYTAKARYLGIDTPESTSELEEWGKTASLYNESCLSTAKHIIVHGQIDEGGYNADTGKYEYTFNVTTDGNQRNLLYVWYTDKESPSKDDFRCLNLEMVYQGLSHGIGSQSDMGSYFYRYFEKANKSAMANERHMYTTAYHSDTNYWYEDPVSLTLKNIYDTTTTSTDSKYNDKKTLYRIRGYVTRTIEGSFYFQDQPSYDQTEGLPEAYGMYVFTYAQTPISVGDYVEVIGVLSDYGGTYQMMGISYHDINPDANRDTRIISSNHTITPITLTMAEFNSKKYPLVLTTISETMYCTDVVNSYGSISDGGAEEINKYNTKYPFYNTSNKIVTFMTTEQYKDTSFTSMSNANMIRLQIDENILIKYEGSYAYSPKFFIGGSYNYNPQGAEYVDWNPEEHEGVVNPYASETVTKTFERKSMSVTCISAGYVSTGGNAKQSAIIVSKTDVKNLTNAQ